jgi:5-methylcytosine-specific restriction endonuclease McrA
MNDFLEFAGVDEAVIRQERDKAKVLRKSGWWQRKIGSGICYYCGSQQQPKELTMDHIVPLGRGGRSTKGNLVPACKECNNRKKTLLPLEWEEYMATLHGPGTPPD